jgi:hypothetical protein
MTVCDVPFRVHKSVLIVYRFYTSYEMIQRHLALSKPPGLDELQGYGQSKNCQNLRTLKCETTACSTYLGFYLCRRNIMLTIKYPLPQVTQVVKMKQHVVS